jgi:hypothetical protein
MNLSLRRESAQFFARTEPGIQGCLLRNLFPKLRPLPLALFLPAGRFIDSSHQLLLPPVLTS